MRKYILRFLLVLVIVVSMIIIPLGRKNYSHVNKLIIIFFSMSLLFTMLHKNLTGRAIISIATRPYSADIHVAKTRFPTYSKFHFKSFINRSNAFLATQTSAGWQMKCCCFLLQSWSEVGMTSKSVSLLYPVRPSHGRPLIGWNSDHLWLFNCFVKQNNGTVEWFQYWFGKTNRVTN